LVLVLDRRPFVDEATPLLQHVLAGDLEAKLAATSITTLFYVRRTIVGAERALLTVELCLRTFDIVAVDLHILDAAAHMLAPDFGDDVQQARAAAIAADAIVTRDRRGFANSPIPVFTPTELLKRLPA
jgi:hypothetical protein